MATKTTTHRLTLALVAAFAGVALVCASAQPAQARPRPRTAKFSANKSFGLGVMLGAPSGLSGKYYLGADTALDFGLGVIGGYGNRSGLHLHGDFLWHPAVLATVDPFVLALYFGVGGRVWDFDDNRRVENDLALGVRVPVGLAMDFNSVPIDVFFELAFVLDFFVGNGGADAELNGALGVRYYF